MRSGLRQLRKLLPALAVILPLVVGCVSTSPTQQQGERWLRGNTHAHSLWSDGDDYPEMIVKWYKDHGYDFVALSDHNVFAAGEKWVSRRKGTAAFDKYVEAFGQDWVETRDVNGQTKIRLKTLDEFRPKLEEAGTFLILQAEEITSRMAGKHIHVNAVNLPGDKPIPAINKPGGMTVREVIREHLQAVAQREQETGQPILAHLNHPNFGWAITAEDLAHVVEEQFFEVYNGHPGINHLGNAGRPGDEQIWDIANTIRLIDLDAEPLFGVASDDSHKYHGGNNPPGRGWVMVRAPQLDGDAIVRAMRAGNFYSSSGVLLKSIEYDPAQRRLDLEIEPVEGVTFTTQWIGTRRAETVASATIGEVFEEQSGTRVSFLVPEDALYARATITSSRPHPRASFSGQMEQAWVQPVGWKKE